MCDYFYFILISGDVVHCKTSDRMIKSCALDVTYLQGVCVDIQLDDNSIEMTFILNRPSWSYNDQD